MGQSEALVEPAVDSTASAVEKEHEDEPRKKPELLVRTYVATMRSSDQFGPMVAAVAHRRNFMKALHRAFLGDGSAWIWTLQKSFMVPDAALADVPAANRRLVHVL
jgi:hypothetical protein